VSDPTEKLDVGGVASFNGIKVGGNGTDIDSTFLGANSIMAFRNNGTEHVRIDNSGNVGIGTTSPSTKLGAYSGLSIAGSNAGLQLQGSAFSSILFGDAADADVGQIAYDHSQNALRVFTNASEHMRIDNSGRVGIGDPNPTGILHAVKDVTPASVDTHGTAVFAASAGEFSGRLNIAASDSTGNAYLWAVDRGVAASNMILQQYGGNVGIGTDAPQATLQVKGLSSLAANTGYRKGWIGGAGTWGANSYEELGVGFSGIRSVSTGSGRWDLTFATGTSTQFVNGTQPERMRIDTSGNLLVGRTSVSAAATDHGWQAYNTGIVYQYANAATSTDVHRWYNGAGSLVASINARGEGFFLGGATYSGPLKADEIIQDGAPVVDSLQIIRAFMKLRAATADPDSTVEELREKLKTAVDDIIDQFQDQIDNMPTPLED
jgi:hypothetical protein